MFKKISIILLLTLTLTACQAKEQQSKEEDAVSQKTVESVSKKDDNKIVESTNNESESKEENEKVSDDDVSIDYDSLTEATYQYDDSDTLENIYSHIKENDPHVLDIKHNDDFREVTVTVDKNYINSLHKNRKYGYAQSMGNKFKSITEGKLRQNDGYRPVHVKLVFDDGTVFAENKNAESHKFVIGK